MTQPTVLILGGGLAGLAAAQALAPRGFRVTLLEARNRLGGRAGSFQDAASGQLVDACQHVTMGCCTNFEFFCRSVGIAPFLRPQPTLYFMTPDRRVSRFRAAPFPAPLHLARSFSAAHFLTTMEKLRVGYGLLRLKCDQRDDDPPFQDWLRQHGQTPRSIDRFWGLVLTSALNESPDRVGLRYARKVFVDGFLEHPKGFEVSLPTVPLGRLYGEELHAWFRSHGVETRWQEAAKRIEIAQGRVKTVETRAGERLSADWVVSAVTHDRLLAMLDDEVIESEPYFAQLRNLEVSPITSVHVWWDRKVVDLPHVVLMEGVGQWVFNRGETAPNSWYTQVVVSAARQFRGMTGSEIERLVVDEMQRLFPAARNAEVKRARVVTEHAATFSAVPGVDRWRPVQASPLANLLVAGDWTATGWPATMEGAVRSGYLAAEALLARCGIKARFVRPDLA